MELNIYAWIILLTILISTGLDFLADFLNIKNLKKDLPEEFKDVYSEEKYQKSQEYLKERTRFGLISSVFSLVLLLGFWFLGGFNYVDIWVRSLTDSYIYQGLIYMSALLAAQSIIGIPFSIYSTFVIEEKYGFNKTTISTFIMDRVKSILLGALIGLPILAGLLYLLNSFGEYSWLYGWICLTVISFALQFIAPRWIMPLFNKFTPLEDGELKTAIFNYAAKVDYSLKHLFVMDGSKRSAKSNAFFTGFGKNKRIALFDTLIEKHTNGELVAILAHEIGHFKKKHIIKSMIISVLHTGVLFYIMSLFLSHKPLYDAFFVENIGLHTGLIFFTMLFSPIENVLSVLMNVFSRKNEYEADRYAVETTGKKEDMINALKKLSEHNLSNLTPHKFFVFMNYSHPPVLERIRAIKSI